MTLNTKKWEVVHLSQIPYNLDDTYDWEGGLMDGDEEHLYHAILKLWLVREVSPNELKFLLEIYVGMTQRKDNTNYPL
jgi:hypothetical protein